MKSRAVRVGQSHCIFCKNRAVISVSRTSWVLALGFADAQLCSHPHIARGRYSSNIAWCVPNTRPPSRLAPPLLPAGVTHLPAGITKLKALASLDVSGCPLTFLPSGLGRLQALRHLRLNGTNLMVGLGHIWEPLAKLPLLESVELRWVGVGGACVVGVTQMFVLGGRGVGWGGGAARAGGRGRGASAARTHRQGRPASPCSGAEAPAHRQPAGAAGCAWAWVALSVRSWAFTSAPGRRLAAGRPRRSGCRRRCRGSPRSPAWT